ncbi:hypothetical protein [Faecalispora anaeroviscerum]|uniref:hypothetical protein n=1 Tax=Faecalispora anaeroviscerum TaxID=2991836 RepID=UPI0024B8F55B|nr:hypothetical protein [Faecalispora anaeroviscerum]
MQLSAALYNTFSRGWFDQCNTLQNIAEMATDANSKKSTDYLLGYLRGGTSSRTGYFLQNIYSNQSALENQLISPEIKQSLNTYTSAESDYLEQLGNRLKTDNRIPQEETFQSNTKKLAELAPSLNIRTSDLRKETQAKAFQENLEKATQLMKAAFPQSNSTGAFAPSDNIIILPG